MRYRLFHIILSLFLTIAVTDYIWYDLLDHDQTSIELETESKEEVGENKLSESKHDLGEFHFPSYLGFRANNLFSGVFKFGNSYRPLTPDNHPKYYITYCQLKLHC